MKNMNFNNKNHFLGPGASMNLFFVEVKFSLCVRFFFCAAIRCLHVFDKSYNYGW